MLKTQTLSTASEAEDRNSRSGGVEDRNSRSDGVDDRNSRSVESMTGTHLLAQFHTLEPIVSTVRHVTGMVRIT